MLLSALFMLVEPALNEALSYDIDAQKKLIRLENKKFSVTLTDLNISVSLLVINSKVKLMTNVEDFDCLVKTSVDRLNLLSDAAVLTKLIKSDELQLEGDLAIAQAYSSLLMESDIDWQEWLSKYVGDAMAHRMANVLASIQLLVARKMADLDYTVATTLTDELRLTPDAIELTQFSDDVDQLNARSERLQAKFSQFRKSV